MRARALKVDALLLRQDFLSVAVAGIAGACSIGVLSLHDVEGSLVAS